MIKCDFNVLAGNALSGAGGALFGYSLEGLVSSHAGSGLLYMGASVGAALAAVGLGVALRDRTGRSSHEDVSHLTYSPINLSSRNSFM